jgi:hypothetical protein
MTIRILEDLIKYFTLDYGGTREKTPIISEIC